MKKLKLYALLFALVSFTSVIAQVQIDKPIQLTNTGGNAKVEGVDEIINNHDATNKIYVDTAIANRTGIDMDVTISASPATVTMGSSSTTSGATPVIVSVAAFTGKLTPVIMSVTGLPSGVSYTLTPAGGYPLSLNMSLVFSVTSATSGSYPITITATGGIAPRSTTITLNIIGKRVFVTSLRSMADSVV